MEEQWVLSDNATPIEICGHALGRLSMVWDDFADKTGTGHGEFLPKIFSDVWENGSRGEDFEKELDEWEFVPPDIQPLGLIQAVLICTAYACQGMRAQKADDMHLAWNYTTKCKYWLGIVLGAWSIRKDNSVQGSFARLGAQARHSENRAIKSEVMAWLDANKTLALNGEETASEIAGKIAPIKWRTAREYITEWKKLRSAGKP